MLQVTIGLIGKLCISKHLFLEKRLIQSALFPNNIIIKTAKRIRTVDNLSLTSIYVFGMLNE